MKVRVISPHLDDAVWSAAGILERHDATLSTICAGIPPPSVEPTQFDRRAGFDSAREAMEARRREDEKASEILSCEVRHLDCLDLAYGGKDHRATVVLAELKLAQMNDEVVVGPLGLRHPDHQAVGEAFRHGVEAMGLNAWAYEELPYAYVWPEFLGPALKLARCGERTITRPSEGAKEAAVNAYHSQVRGAHLDAIFAPERYHRIPRAADL